MRRRDDSRDRSGRRLLGVRKASGLLKMVLLTILEAKFLEEIKS